MSRYSLNKNKYLLEPEVQELLRLMDKFKTQDPRNTLIILLALRTGARAQELLNLKIGDLNAYDETIFIQGIKGSNDREIPIESMLFQRVLRYAQTVDGVKLFDFSYARLYQIWENYRPIKKKFHSLRHTFAIQIYQKTKDIRLVQVALGHRNVMNTMIYADYVYSQQELRRLIV
ncbi:MAG: tyrosine-type recombinase/integrase [Pseudobdellovibrionaceae bacterium]